MTSSYTFISSAVDLQFLLSPTPADPSPTFVRDGDKYGLLELPLSSSWFRAVSRFVIYTLRVIFLDLVFLRQPYNREREEILDVIE